MDQLRVGVIGCGGMAKSLMRKCVLSGKAIISAVSDPDPTALKTASEEFGAIPVDDLNALSRLTDVDAVMVGSPPGNHIEGVVAAAASHKPVYCEKPLGVNVAQCDAMIKACSDAGVPLFVGQVLRLFPLFHQSRTIIDDGTIGIPKAISITRAGYGTLFHSGWRYHKDLAGGLLLEINAHELDYMRFILGEPKEVYARANNILGKMEYEDQIFVVISFENGGTGCLHSSMSSPNGEYRVHIQGTEGNMLHGGFGGALNWRRTDNTSGEVKAEDVKVPDPYDRELNSWMDSLLKGTEPLFTGKDGRAAVAIAEAAYRSVELNRPVAINEL